MATLNQTHVHDLSTLANFKDWAQSIGSFLSGTAGWVQSSDTGQVNWGTIVSVPTSGTSVYEIWKPGDALATFYVRIDYANNGGTQPQIKMQCGTTTNGAGTLTGFTTAQTFSQTAANTGSTLFNCLYCGDTSSFVIIMWRDAATGYSTIFGVDRSRDTSGNATGTYFTHFHARDNNNAGGQASQQSVVFGVGAAIQGLANVAFNTFHGMSLLGFGGARTQTFNGNNPFYPVFPMVGYFDTPTLVVGHLGLFDFSELAVVTTTLLGSTHTFLFSKSLSLAGSFGLGFLMRWE